MIFVDFDPLFWTQILVALAIIIQVTELITIRQTFDDSGVWRWKDLQRELDDLPKWVVRIFDALFSYKTFIILLHVELLAAFVQIFTMHPVFVGFLLFMAIATAVRWRGTFNGGSDYMTVVLLSALFVASLFPRNEAVALGAIYYIAVVSCLSYFISGVAKLRSPSWRDGTALLAFLSSSNFPLPERVERSLQSRLNCRIDSWFIVGYECLFPFALLHPTLCRGFLLLGAGFHLANSYMLGLNRFFFVWIATYPAILWCCGL